ncbi:(2Fe-2S)-binding protein [Cellulomonas dongxiuzhuiae]|uniref:(2Fe-2S)-binding protein n=1 Tax=Cellulomonas dongxiuzhuiae TaxID=2819979 RepID=A0ABX8GH46_9CELL|nr:(2Fe-2S)-binding protein [Cellulomonas dongxiuzhuiae]MBO3088214.1 (2Fe-2S)-binding protein [Cellulomonas dongxiuzhuiae]MBO3094439.1 (2Fe-2S)-binding protein [Cellulomonas dongxiuzhuiae]QWC15464.1 (2Fe-2S)-binding protein [Cellulomonas dongxiuzhuiae]
MSGPVDGGARAGRVAGARGAGFTLRVDGHDVAAYDGESIAAALLAGGVEAFRTTADGTPRAPFCHMGTCFECVVRVGGRSVRACLTPATPGDDIGWLDERDPDERRAG